MELAYRLSDSSEAELLPANITVAGRQVTLRLHSATIFIADCDAPINPQLVVSMLDMMLGIQASHERELPGKFKPEPNEQITEEIDRLIAEQDLEFQELQKITEPQIELNLTDPSLDSMVPTGLKVWDSCFVKLPPVVDLEQWMATKEADGCVYLPNDSSKYGDDAEQTLSNSLYTEVMVEAYILMCQRLTIKPRIQLASGAVIPFNELCPMAGTQHTVPGERSARIANSKVLDFDDSGYAKEFIQAICDLKPWQYDKEPVRRRVLAKVEYILMGRTSHTYNQRFIHALYNSFVNDTSEVPWAKHRVAVASCVMAILKQMVVEGLVLEDNKELFLVRIRKMGFGAYSEPIGIIYDNARGTHG